MHVSIKATGYVVNCRCLSEAWRGWEGAVEGGGADIIRGAPVLFP